MDHAVIEEAEKCARRIRDGDVEFIPPPAKGGAWNVWYGATEGLSSALDTFKRFPELESFAQDVISAFEKARIQGIMKDRPGVLDKLETAQIENAGLKQTINQLRQENAGMFTECPRCHFTNQNNTSTVQAGP